MKYQPYKPPINSWERHERDPWWCPICDKGHVVPSLVQDCIRKAGGPDQPERSETPSERHKKPKT